MLYERWHHQLDCNLTSGLACVASIFVGLKSIEGFSLFCTHENEVRAKRERGAGKTSKIMFLCLSLLHNPTEVLVTRATSGEFHLPFE